MIEDQSCNLIIHVRVEVCEWDDVGVRLEW